MPITIRPARPDDGPTIADFNTRLAAESEGTHLDPDTVSKGVAAVLSDPAKGFYFVACDGAAVVGQMMFTVEYSDWRNGWIWWLQSVFVAAEYRGQGIFRALFEHVRQQAVDNPEVVGFRLYVEEHNESAQLVYKRLGLQPSGYQVMEQFIRRSVK